MTPAKFRAVVWRHFTAHGRHELPWRKTHNPYRILVSEVMLQQTQVDRVIPYYKNFLKEFPTVDVLAKAPLSNVLRVWQGLGYNRRARMLHEAAKIVVGKYQGRMPKDEVVLELLPGIGPYTARAVAAFAYNRDVIFIETNIRTAVTHHFFPDTEVVADSELLAVLTMAYPEGKAREWYAALMDYGSHLKRSGVKLNAKSASYTKQRSFKGSLREVRGAVMRALLNAPATQKELYALFPKKREAQVRESLVALAAEGMLLKRGTRYRLPS